MTSKPAMRTIVTHTPTTRAVQGCPVSATVFRPEKRWPETVGLLLLKFLAGVPPALILVSSLLAIVGTLVAPLGVDLPGPQPPFYKTAFFDCGETAWFFHGFFAISGTAGATTCWRIMRSRGFVGTVSWGAAGLVLAASVFVLMGTPLLTAVSLDLEDLTATMCAALHDL